MARQVVALGAKKGVLARNYRLSRSRLREIEQIIEERYNELKTAWQDYLRR